jgi:hypothetical protein
MTPEVRLIMNGWLESQSQLALVAQLCGFAPALPRQLLEFSPDVRNGRTASPQSRVKNRGENSRCHEIRRNRPVFRAMYGWATIHSDLIEKCRLLFICRSLRFSKGLPWAPLL